MTDASVDRRVGYQLMLPGAELSDLALANGHRVVRIVGKGNQPALIPLAPRTARAIDAAVGERQRATAGPS